MLVNHVLVILTAKQPIVDRFAENKQKLLVRILETLRRKPEDCVKLVTNVNDDGSYLETDTPIQRATMNSRENNRDLCTQHIVDVKDKDAIVSYSRFLNRNSILIIFSGNSNAISYVRVFEKITNVVLFKEYGNSTFKMIRKRTTSDQNLSYVDLWDGNRLAKDSSLFPSPSRDMKGRMLKANTFDFPPFTYKTAEGYGLSLIHI